MKNLLCRQNATSIAAVCAVISVAFSTRAADPRPVSGPLRIHPENPHYFTDGDVGSSGRPRAILLTGSHTWNNLVDMGRADPPETFNFDSYLDDLSRHGHNFIRLWTWDSTTWDTRANGALGKEDFVHQVAPLPWERTGPGNALDGGPKFDLTRLNPAYFNRLRKRVSAAQERGIYVSVMLFEGWGLMHGNQGRAANDGWAWRTHPFNPDNNINNLRIQGANQITGKVHSLGNLESNELQAAYIRRVVDTVNNLDNVLYEVINEGGAKDWDRWVIRTLRDYERSKPKQHPIGLTGHGAERLESMLDSDADWVSPGRADGYGPDPPAWKAASGKVSILDTDHVWGVGGSADWVWKSLLRGHNPVLMDPYDGSVLGTPGDPRWEPIRRAMGQARRVAERANLASVMPADELASTGFCLADAGREYLVYLPQGGSVLVDMTAADGPLSAEWFDPNTDQFISTGKVAGGDHQELLAPFDGPAVVHLARHAEGS